MNEDERDDVVCAQCRKRATREQAEADNWVWLRIGLVGFQEWRSTEQHYCPNCNVPIGTACARAAQPIRQVEGEGETVIETAGKLLPDKV